MGKGKAQPVIWLLLSRKLTPKQITALGYKENTAYTCAARFPEVNAEFKEKLKAFKEMQTKNNIKDSKDGEK